MNLDAFRRYLQHQGHTLPDVSTRESSLPVGLVVSIVLFISVIIFIEYIEFRCYMLYEYIITSLVS
jgi:hypothetical protein